jgi:hypothetical protein
MTETYKNRYGDEFIFTLLEDGNIQWSGNFEYHRVGYPNIYDKAFEAYKNDGGELTLEEFKTQIHESVYDGKTGDYIGPTELNRKYSMLVYSDIDVIDIVDPSGGPYLREGMELMGKIIQEFKHNKEGYLIITKK